MGKEFIRFRKGSSSFRSGESVMFIFNMGTFIGFLIVSPILAIFPYALYQASKILRVRQSETEGQEKK